MRHGKIVVIDTQIDKQVTIEDIYKDRGEQDLALRTIAYFCKESGCISPEQSWYILHRGLFSMLRLFDWKSYCEARRWCNTPQSLEAHIKLAYALPTYLNKNSNKPKTILRSPGVFTD